jgi:hypothetical protein
MQRSPLVNVRVLITEQIDEPYVFGQVHIVLSKPY